VTGSVQRRIQAATDGPSRTDPPAAAPNPDRDAFAISASLDQHTLDAAHAELERAWHVSEYAKAFYRTTGFAAQLVLLTDHTSVPPPYTQPTNPFCYLLAKLARRRTPCPQVHLQLRQPTADPTISGRVRCPMGLSEVAVPVTVAGRPVAIIYGGQIHRTPPHHKRFLQLAPRLAGCGVSAKDLLRLRAAYFQTPVLTERQYRAAVKMLTIFAHQLADSANGWIVLGHPHEPALIRHAKHFIQTYLTEPLSTNVVAKHLHLSADHLSRAFKKTTGVTLKEYVNRARVQRVKQLLANPDARISEAASAAGFRDFAHFNHTFKRYTGQSPRQFRAKVHPNSTK